MGRPLEHSLEDVLKAIKGSGGIKMNIARRLKVHRHTLDRYLERWATARQAYIDEVESIGDKAESVIIDDIVKQKNVETAKWYAKNKLKDRGYGEALDLNLNEPIHIILDI